MLSRRVGIGYLDDVEDSVQSAMITALSSWNANGLPNNPSAWLYRVAYNNLMGELRKNLNRRKIIEKDFRQNHDDGSRYAQALAHAYHFSEGEINDDLLRMLFVCCDDVLPAESQQILALKTLCGFSIEEISHRLFLTKANVYKRLSRARKMLLEKGVSLELTENELVVRLPSVNRVLYHLFSEGYFSSHESRTIREELCDDAIRLANILASHSLGEDPETYANLALMYLHKARFAARQDSSHGLILLEDQDRKLYDPNQIQMGLEWLSKSAIGDRFSKYHAEAGIAAEHCIAPSFAETRWDRVVELYSMLERISPSVLNTLNHAVALAEWKGPIEALRLLKTLIPTPLVGSSFVFCAVMADIHRRAGNKTEAASYRRQAIQFAPSETVKRVLERRLGNEWN